MIDTEIDRGLLASCVQEELRRAKTKRYRPINATDDVVELSGTRYDALMRMLLGVIHETLGAPPEFKPADPIPDPTPEPTPIRRARRKA